MKDAELGWVAGVVDGEGSIGYFGNGKGYRTATVEVFSTDRDIVERLLLYTGMGAITEAPPDKRGPFKKAWRWRVRKKDDTVLLLQELFPWLCKRKKTRATMVLEAVRPPQNEGE